MSGTKYLPRRNQTLKPSLHTSKLPPNKNYIQIINPNLFYFEKKARKNKKGEILKIYEICQ